MIKNFILLLCCFNFLNINSCEISKRKQSAYVLNDKSIVFKSPSEFLMKLKQILLDQDFGSAVLKELYYMSQNLEAYQLISVNPKVWNALNSYKLCDYFMSQADADLIFNCVHIKKKCLFSYEIKLKNPMNGEIFESLESINIKELYD